MNKDWTCMGFKFESGKMYAHDGEVSPCNSGFHFCLNVVDCFSYYEYNDCIIVKVEASGRIIQDGTKYCAETIVIGEEFEPEEIEDLFTDANRNSGYGNSGNLNSGNGNSGDRNSGDRNSGNGNSGYLNSGNGNSGYGNSGNWNSGIFCTETSALKFFDSDSDWTWEQWINSKAFSVADSIILNGIDIDKITKADWKTLSTMPNWDKDKFIACIQALRAKEKGQ